MWSYDPERFVRTKAYDCPRSNSPERVLSSFVEIWLSRGIMT
jgi:hypothetical protein